MEELKTEVQRKRITEMLDKLEYNLNEVEKASYALNSKLESLITPKEGSINSTVEAPLENMSPLARKLEDLMYIAVRAKENLGRLERDIEL